MTILEEMAKSNEELQKHEAIEEEALLLSFLFITLINQRKGKC